MGIDLNSIADANSIQESLCETARWCHARGWAPATSGNFSARFIDDSSARIFITPSGLDKGTVTPADLLEIDENGRVVKGNGNPSAETALHLVIYGSRPQARAILHVHSIWNTLLSARHAGHDYVQIEGYELLKALTGVATHEHIERLPLLENTQNYELLSQQFRDALNNYPAAHGVLLNRHGLYTWAQSVTAARRHLEAFEFLFEVEERRLATQALPRPMD